MSDDLEYVADIYYLGTKCTDLLNHKKIFCISIQNVKHYIGKYNNFINYINWYNNLVLIDINFNETLYPVFYKYILV